MNDAVARNLTRSAGTAGSTAGTTGSTAGATDGLPRWDVSTYFPSLDSREFSTAEEQAGASLQRLGSLFDRHDVRGGDKALDPQLPMLRCSQRSTRSSKRPIG